MAQVYTDAECVYSRLAADPDLQEVVDMFVQDLSQRAAALLSYLNEGDWQNLRRVAHQIKGAAGSYGFDAVSPAAGRLESALRDGEPEERIRAAVVELTNLCGRVRGGPPPSQE